MKLKKIADNVYMIACLDWDRRLFDSLIPLPDGTSYNSYIIKGSEKTVMVDSVDPEFSDLLLHHLQDIKKIDFIIANHAEQDHSGTIPKVLEKYPDSKVITTAIGRSLLMAHLHIPEDRFQTVKDGESISLGDKTLEFMHMPWVHWPETMVTYLREDRMLFSCDFFGSHIATTDTFVTDEGRVYEAAKRYYAEIMMPFRKMIQKHLARLAEYDIGLIAPSHGPAYNKPEFILEAYKEWVSDQPKNVVVVPYISMHGSTKRLVNRLVQGLANEGITVYQFDLAVTDIGKLAIALVDAATIVVGVPTVRSSPHPNVMYALNVANVVVPKARYAAVLNSYGWSNESTLAAVTNAIPNLKVEVVGAVGCKGLPTAETYKEVDQLVRTISEKHKEDNLI
ncbi:MAG: FprA family A-type flavoprotein [Candidatus Coatesbacteria bacterium]|nr:MAG: FprA family A-type flavoprotein [Candidatus Coatesbacteria bacterium]